MVSINNIFFKNVVQTQNGTKHQMSSMHQMKVFLNFTFHYFELKAKYAKKSYK
jgi:hypothetical protein